MSDGNGTHPGPIQPQLLIHQEGLLAVVAIVGLSLTERGLAGGLAPIGSLVASVATGFAGGTLCVAALWLTRDRAPLHALEAWQRRLVAEWSAVDGLAVALVSGLAEEALVRALLQPLIGLVPAAVVFAALHIVPDRRLWAWPVLALCCGLGLGVLFQQFGYPAAATAHVLINGVAFLRLTTGAAE